MKILITGSSGFIGKNLAETLGLKHRLFLPAHREVDFSNAEQVKKYFKENQFEAIIHAANVGGSKRSGNLTETVRTNLRMFVNLLSARTQNQKIIFLGSGAEYDKRRDIVNIEEQQFGESIPADDYGFAKYLCSKLIESEKNIINLRCFGVFGKYEDYGQRFMSNIICKLLLGLPVSMHQNAVFDFIWVEDLARIIEYFLENPAKEKFYNTGSGQKISLLEMADLIRKISGKNFELEIKNPGFNKEYTCSIERLKAEMEFIPTPYQESLKNLYDYYVSNQEKLDRNLFLV